MPISLRRGDLRQDLQIVTDISMSRGGLYYERTAPAAKVKRNGASAAQAHTLIRVVDNEAVVTAMGRHVKEADHACRKTCASTDFGWVTPIDRIAGLRGEFVEFSAIAARLNATAKREGSQQRIRTAIVVSALEVDDVVLQSLEMTLQSIAEAFIEALRSGLIKGSTNNNYRKVVLRAGNLDALLAGEAKERYDRMIEAAAQAREYMKEALDDRQSVEAAFRRIKPEVDTMLAFGL